MSILISQNLTVNTTPADLANRPLILVENVFQLGTVTASSEVGADNGWLENAVDGMTYDWWEWSALPATLEVTLSTAHPVDMCAIGLHTGLTFVFQYWNGSAWVNLHEAVTTTTTAVHAVIFTEITASRYRINVTAVDDENILGIVMLGKAIQLPKTFYGSHAPITLNRTTQLVRNRTENGFDAGVYSLRTGAATSIEISNMKPAWIRNNLESLNKQLEIRPFVFAWRPETFPNDVAYCWLNSPIKAENSGPRDLMSLSFDVQAFVGGGIVAPIIERLLIGNRQSPWLGLYEDAESALTLDSSPTGLTETTDCSAIAIHRKGVIAASFFQGGVYTYEYRNGVWTAMPALTDLVTWNYGVDIHTDDAKWMVLAVGFSPNRINLYKRVTGGDGVNGFYYQGAITGIRYCKFSPDGELLVVGNSTSIIVYSFNAETGVTTSLASYAIGQFFTSLAWSPDSLYLAVCNSNDAPRFKIYKRDIADDSLALLTIDAFSGTIPSSGSGIANNLAWHPDESLVIIGLETSTFLVYKNNGADEFNDVTSAVVDVQPGLGGRVYTMEWSADGTRLYVGIGDGSLNNICIYDYANGLLIRRSTQLIGATANSIGDIQGVRFSNGAVSIVPATVEVAVAVFNSLDEEVIILSEVGDYTIRPTITITPDIASAVSSVRFYVDEVLVFTDTTAPYERVFSVALEDDLTTVNFRVDVFDAYGNIITANRNYEIDFTIPFIWDTAATGTTISGDGKTASTVEAGAALRIVKAARTKTSGKFSVRFLVTVPVGNVHGCSVGVLVAAAAGGAYLGSNASGWGGWVDNTTLVSKGELSIHNAVFVGYGNIVDFTTPKEVALDIDFDTGNLWLAYNGVYVNSGSPIHTNVTGGEYNLVCDLRAESSIQIIESGYLAAVRSGFTDGWR